MTGSLKELDLTPEKAWIVNLDKWSRYWGTLSKEDLTNKIVVYELKKTPERLDEINAVIESIYQLGDDLELDLRRTQVKAEDVHYYHPEGLKLISPSSFGFAKRTGLEDSLEQHSWIDILRSLKKNKIACITESEDTENTMRVTAHEITHTIAESMGYYDNLIIEGLTELFSAISIVKKWPEHKALKKYNKPPTRNGCAYSVITNFVYELISDISNKTGWSFTKSMKQFYKSYFFNDNEELEGNRFNKRIREIIDNDPTELGEELLNGKVKRELKSIMKRLDIPVNNDFETMDILYNFEFREGYISVHKLSLLLYMLYHKSLKESLGETEDPLDSNPYTRIKEIFHNKRFNDPVFNKYKAVNNLLDELGIKKNTCTPCPILYCKLEKENNPEQVNQCESEDLSLA